MGADGSEGASTLRQKSTVRIFRFFARFRRTTKASAVFKVACSCCVRPGAQVVAGKVGADMVSGLPWFIMQVQTMVNGVGYDILIQNILRRFST